MAFVVCVRFGSCDFAMGLLQEDPCDSRCSVRFFFSEEKIFSLASRARNEAAIDEGRTNLLRDLRFD